MYGKSSINEWPRAFMQTSKNDKTNTKTGINNNSKIVYFLFFIIEKTNKNIIIGKQYIKLFLIMSLQYNTIILSKFLRDKMPKIEL